MKKEQKTPVAPVAPAQGVPAKKADAPVAAEVAPQAKKWISRLCGLLFLAACGLVGYFVSFMFFHADWTIEKNSLFDVAKSLKDSSVKLFGFLPALFEGKGVAELLANLAPYVIALFLVVAAILFLVALLSGNRCCVKTGLVFVMLGMAAQVLFVFLVSNSKTEETFDTNAVSVFAVAVVLLVLVCFITRKRKPKPAPVDPVAEMLKSFKTEEVIEAYAYEGGPVAGIEVAQEVYPTVAALDAQRDPDGAARNTVASLLGNGFDAFLITLNEKEKNEFIDTYVLKCRGIMPEIPGYVVGGDNKDFFNKVFIYLGQYREKISGDLLSKMYNFSMKI